MSTPCIIIPKSRETSGAKVRCEEYIKDAKTLTILDRIPQEEQREYQPLVALGAQHYLSQLFNVESENEETLVHSDVSKGNYAVTQDGNLAVLDRGMYLRFNKQDRNFISALANPFSSAEDRINIALDFLATEEENQDFLDDATEREELIEILNQIFANPSEQTLTEVFIAIQQRGYEVPLKYNLLVKNLNAWQQMAQAVGFTGIFEAASFTP